MRRSNKLSKLKKLSSGMTVIEILLAVGLFFMLVYLASAGFVQIQISSLLKDNAWQIASIVRQAQSNSVSGEAINSNHLRFGVLFTSDYYQEFATLTDFSNREESYDLLTTLPKGLTIVDFDLPDNCLQVNDCVIFSPIEGTPSSNGSIGLLTQADEVKKTITINQDGKVNF